MSKWYIDSPFDVRSDEKVNEASLISGASGPVTISNSTITIVAGGNTRNDKESALEGDPRRLSEIMNALKLDEKDITWLQPKKYLFFHKKPINNSSKVFYGQQVLPDRCRDVAVKLILYTDGALKELAFLTEARHPNIVQIFDAGELHSMGHWMYMVMELCTKNLRQYVEDLGGDPLEIVTFVTMFSQLLNGLEYLHDNNILHRDIKPDNILVTKSGMIKYSDFGISKQIELERGEVTQTKYGAGSDGYRPPETYIENAKLTTAADIFSLALVVIHLISNGRHAYGPVPYDWGYNIRKNRIPNLSIIPKHIPPKKRAQLTDIVTCMLKVNPCQRPSVKQIIDHEFFKATPISMGAMEEDKAKGVMSKYDKKKGALTKDDIGIPQDFKHVEHIGLPPNTCVGMRGVDPALEGLLAQAGVSEAQLEDPKTVQLIRNFIDKNDAAKQSTKQGRPLPSHLRGLQLPLPPPPSSRTSGIPPSTGSIPQQTQSLPSPRGRKYPPHLRRMPPPPRRRNYPPTALPLPPPPPSPYQKNGNNPPSPP